ncbi:AAA family ATPase [Subtercola boreus]|uniref:AAA family ATPase n=1 Tax=Subtercola boreus TaxID=120213 RepID=UPI001558AB45
MRIALLGGLRVDHEGRAVTVSGTKQLAVLFRLAVDAGVPVSYRAIAEDVWGLDAPENSKAALQWPSSSWNPAERRRAQPGAPGHRSARPTHEPRRARARTCHDRRTAAGNRLVTIIGTGGAGKTRLALETAFHRENALLVELAPVGPSEVTAAVLTATGRELRTAETTGESSRTRILESLAGRDVLLVLDNCEHVIDTAAALSQDLLSALPRLLILGRSSVARRWPGARRRGRRRWRCRRPASAASPGCAPPSSCRPFGRALREPGPPRRSGRSSCASGTSVRPGLCRAAVSCCQPPSDAQS